jgi:hypothetical protein
LHERDVEQGELVFHWPELPPRPAYVPFRPFCGLLAGHYRSVPALALQLLYRSLNFGS